MVLQEISIMIENSPGIIYEITEALANASINLHALILADSGGFGVLRLIVSDTKKARQIIMEKNLPAKIQNVIAVNIDNSPGGLTKVLKPLFLEHINIEYMYAFSEGENEAVTVFKFSDNEKAEEILKKYNITPASTKN